MNPTPRPTLLTPYRTHSGGACKAYARHMQGACKVPRGISQTVAAHALQPQSHRGHREKPVCKVFSVFYVAKVFANPHSSRVGWAKHSVPTRCPANCGSACSVRCGVGTLCFAHPTTSATEPQSTQRKAHRQGFLRVLCASVAKTFAQARSPFPPLFARQKQIKKTPARWRVFSRQ